MPSARLARAAGRECGHVVWEGNTGDANVYYRGQLLGPVTGTYELGEPQRGDDAERARREPREEVAEKEPSR